MKKMYYQFKLVAQNDAYREAVISVGDRVEASEHFRQNADVVHHGYTVWPTPLAVFEVPGNSAVPPLDMGPARSCWASVRHDRLFYGAGDGMMQTKTYMPLCDLVFRELVRRDKRTVSQIANAIEERAATRFLDLKVWWELRKLVKKGVVFKSENSYTLRSPRQPEV